MGLGLSVRSSAWVYSSGCLESPPVRAFFLLGLSDPSGASDAFLLPFLSDPSLLSGEGESFLRFFRIAMLMRCVTMVFAIQRQESRTITVRSSHCSESPKAQRNHMTLNPMLDAFVFSCDVLPRGGQRLCSRQIRTDVPLFGRKECEVSLF